MIRTRKRMSFYGCGRLHIFVGAMAEEKDAQHKMLYWTRLVKLRKLLGRKLLGRSGRERSLKLEPQRDLVRIIVTLRGAWVAIIQRLTTWLHPLPLIKIGTS